MAEAFERFASSAMSEATALGTGVSKSAYDAARSDSVGAGVAAVAAFIDVSAAAAPSRPAIFLSISFSSRKAKVPTNEHFYRETIMSALRQCSPYSGGGLNGRMA